jgi:hypothetical protein
MTVGLNKKTQRGNQKTLFFTATLAVVGVVGFFFSLIFTAFAAKAPPKGEEKAGAPTLEITAPTPNAVLYEKTNITFEVMIRSGDAGHTFTVEWETLWDGKTEAWPVPAEASATTPVINTFPASANQPAYTASLRYTRNFSTIVPLPALGQKNVRVKVTDVATGSSAIASGRYYLVNNIIFTGYTWAGATTVDGGDDAVGWTSFSCANRNDPGICTGIPAYNIKVTTPSSGSTFATLEDIAWVGETDATNKAVGWVIYNKKYCDVNSALFGEYCANDAACGGGAGTCKTLLDAFPNNEVVNENWPTRNDGSYVYASTSNGRYPGQVAGWARALTLRNYGNNPIGQTDWGWVHLRGAEAPEPSPDTQPGIKYTNMSVGGYHQCSDCSSSSSGSKCNTCQKVQLNSGDPETAWKRYACNSCYGCSSTTGVCDTCERCDLYGVSYNLQKGTLVGFAWAGGANTSGFGWVEYDPTLGGVTLLQAWLATRYGDIFAGGPISKTGALPAPPTGYNATYVIQANGAIEFTSKAGAGYVQPEYPSTIPLPTQGNQYINVLGRLDFATMTTPGLHRYGTTVSVGTDDLDTYINTTLGGKLDGKIHYRIGNATIDQLVEIKAGTGNQNGAGTFIIDGDLHINADVTYELPSSIGNIVNLPSVAWLVRGNVIIDSNVGHSGTETSPNIVGALIVVGYKTGAGNGLFCPSYRTCNGDLDGTQCTSDAECTAPQECKTPIQPIPGGGIVTTGSSPSNFLIINGLMMAKCFHFQRTAQVAAGSEQIVYDGRMIANTPPGLSNLTAALPIIREVTPE